MKAKSFNTKSQVFEFYDARYKEGYMADWDRARLELVFRCIQAAALPARGVALDFGCGQGIFTQLLKRALPGWEVYGCDISAAAIASAQARFPDCVFFVADAPPVAGFKCDFIFTHHVLEHVLDLPATVDQMLSYLRPDAHQLHILPCGNRGSFEHTVAQLTQDGIQPQRGNRYFFEDEGHLRRLTSDELAAHLGAHGYAIRDARFTGHLSGAIEWITRSPKAFVQEFANPAQGVSAAASAQLRRIRRYLLLIWYARCASQSGFRQLLGQLARALQTVLVTTAKLCLWPAASVVDQYYLYRARQEWRQASGDPRGSQMLLLFERTTSGHPLQADAAER